MSPKNTKVVVIGLGSMGMGVALSLLRAGFNVTGCDVNPRALEQFAQAGGHTLDSPKDIDKDCNVVIAVVVSAIQIEEILFGTNGIVPKLRDGALFIACSTVSPEFAMRTADRLVGAGISYLDAPISGGAVKAAAGQLSVMGSGSKNAFAKARGVLQAIAEKVYEIGDRPGQGSSMKMINQLLAGVHITAAAEAMSLAVKIGLDPRVVYEVITHSAGMSWMFENRVPHILDGDYEAHSAVNIFVKDLGIVLDTANSHRFPVPLAATAHQLFTMAASAGMGDWDDAAVAKVYERVSDISLPESNK
ncbi:MAG: L-threonate dehydrogenase [Acidiferrobacterales bacterium]